MQYPSGGGLPHAQRESPLHACVDDRVVAALHAATAQRAEDNPDSTPALGNHSTGLVRIIAFSVGLVHSSDDIEVGSATVHNGVRVARVRNSGRKPHIGPTADSAAVHVVPCHGNSVAWNRRIPS